MKKVLIILLSCFTLPIYAGIDWSQYDEGPDLFFGWKNSLFFAIAAVILFWLSGVLTKSENKSGNQQGSCLIVIVNIAMILCAICSFYLMVPLLIVGVILNEIFKNNKQ